MTQRWFAQKISFLDAAVVIASITFAWQYGFLFQPLTTSVIYTALFTLGATAVLWLSTHYDLLRTSLCYLALPYLFFMPGWISLPIALLLCAITAYGLYRCLHTVTASTASEPDWNTLFVWLAVLVWINLSGIGGYGYQWGDYIMHNARLHDITMRDWPVHYGQNQNLVYYIGYFIPAAVSGKLLGLPAALFVLYLWATCGVMLILRWLAELSGWCFSAGLALVFMLFGPLDLINYSYLASQLKYTYAVYWWERTDYIDFASRYYLDFFIGNYLSNTYQLFVSPQQVIAGWLGAGMLTALFLREQQRIMIFVYSLLCLWAPLPMIAIAPLLFTAFAHERFRSFLSAANLAGLVLLLVFMAFYLGGSAGENPSYWLVDKVNWGERWDGYAMFLLCGWGIYALAIAMALPGETAAWRWWFAGLVASLFLLPVRTFGEVGDLLCRGSAPLMFVLLVFLLRTISRWWQTGAKWQVFLLALLLMTGAGSALLTLRLSLRHYGETYPMSSIIDHVNAYPNLGPDDTFFNRYLRKPPVVKTP